MGLLNNPAQFFLIKVRGLVGTVEALVFLLPAEGKRGRGSAYRRMLGVNELAAAAAAEKSLTP